MVPTAVVVDVVEGEVVDVDVDVDVDVELLLRTGVRSPGTRPAASLRDAMASEEFDANTEIVSARRVSTTHAATNTTIRRRFGLRHHSGVTGTPRTPGAHPMPSRVEREIGAGVDDAGRKHASDLGSRGGA